MDTISARHSSKTMPQGTDYTKIAVTVFIVGFIAFAVGIWAGVNFLAGIGLFGFVISFLYLHSMLWARLMDRKSFRKMMSDTRLSRTWYS